MLRATGLRATGLRANGLRRIGLRRIGHTGPGGIALSLSREATQGALAVFASGLANPTSGADLRRGTREVPATVTKRARRRVASGSTRRISPGSALSHPSRTTSPRWRAWSVAEAQRVRGAYAAPDDAPVRQVVARRLPHIGARAYRDGLRGAELEGPPAPEPPAARPRTRRPSLCPVFGQPFASTTTAIQFPQPARREHGAIPGHTAAPAETPAGAAPDHRPGDARAGGLPRP